MGTNLEVRKDLLAGNLDAVETSSQKRGSAGEEKGTGSTDWRKLFSASSDQSLQYFAPRRSEGKLIVVSPSEVINEGEQIWKNAIVVQFVGRIPNFGAFQKMVNMLWGEEGEVDIRPAGHNLFIIQFLSSAMRDRVLESGPWHIQNKPLIVRKWEPEMRSLEFNMARLPIWVHLGNIPLELFSQKGISYIASALGNPLYMDRFTASQQRLAFARVCVEMDAAAEVPKSIEVEMKNGHKVSVSVTIPWMPIKCSYCHIFGHNGKDCSNKPIVVPAKVWKPKQVEGDGMEVAKEGVEQMEGKSAQKKDKGEAQLNIDVREVTDVQVSASSLNRFALLDSVEEPELIVENEELDEEQVFVEPKKVRAAASGVADLMKSLKPKKKVPDKARQKKVSSNALGGNTPSASS